MKTNKVIEVDGTEIVLLYQNDKDYISLTDIAKHKNAEIPATVISHWMSTVFSVNYMGLWERMNNPNFTLTGFREVKMALSETGFALSPTQWINKTSAIGIITKSGRYGGGTFAHRNIAFEFASWISPEFKYYLVSEFERLKEQEQQQLSSEWNLQRTIAKINYHIHTDAIKQHIVPQIVSEKQKSFTYANEADLLNVALFGKTAAQWRTENPAGKGNVRDEATLEQLVVLSNLESINALLIKNGLAQAERLAQLNATAIVQLKSLLEHDTMKQLKKGDK
jgi:hypothetical protein